MFSKVMNEEKAQKLLEHLENKPNNIEKYIEQLKKDYQLSDEELYDRLKKGMFSKVMNEEKAQKLLDHLENKPNNIDDEINKIEKERQTLVKRFKPKEQKFEKLKNDESELEQDFEKENEEDENEIISTRDGEYLSKKDRFVKWVKNLPLSVKIGACVAGAVALGAAIYHFTQGDAQPLSDIIQNAADAVRGTAQSVTPPEPVDLSGLGDLNIPVYESFSNAASMVNPLHANEWFQWDNIQNMLLSDGRIIDCSNMPHEDIIQMCKDGIAKGIGFGMDENNNMSGFTNAQELLQHLQSSVGGRTL